MAPYATATDGLKGISGSTQETALQALHAASLDIDAAFGAAGYVVPIVVADIDDAVSKERFAAWVALTCTNLARQRLTGAAPRNRGQTPKARKDKDASVDDLERIRSGALFFPFLARTRRAGLRIVGGVEWRATPVLFDREDAAHASVS